MDDASAIDVMWCCGMERWRECSVVCGVILLVIIKVTEVHTMYYHDRLIYGSDPCMLFSTHSISFLSLSPSLCSSFGWQANKYRRSNSLHVIEMHLMVWMTWSLLYVLYVGLYVTRFLWDHYVTVRSTVLGHVSDQTRLDQTTKNACLLLCACFTGVERLSPFPSQGLWKE